VFKFKVGKEERLQQSLQANRNEKSIPMALYLAAYLPAQMGIHVWIISSDGNFYPRNFTRKII
jgi:hypothetical protein